MESLTLLSGHTLPAVGLGTYPLKDEPCKQVIKQALELGYTHFDTAWIYGNQREIGEALRESGVDRSKLFITTKVGQDYLKYDVAIKQADENLQYLQMDYVDLLLVHWPPDDVPMEEPIGAFNAIIDAARPEASASAISPWSKCSRPVRFRKRPSASTRSNTIRAMNSGTCWIGAWNTTWP